MNTRIHASTFCGLQVNLMGHLLYTLGHAGSKLQRRVVTAFNSMPVNVLLRRLSCASHSSHIMSARVTIC